MQSAQLTNAQLRLAASVRTKSNEQRAPTICIVHDKFYFELI